MEDWSPAQYLKFEDERTRPAADLLARVPLDRAARVLDVGCGPGNSTELLAARFPGAAVTGIDASPGMIAAARQRLPGVDFAVADVASFVPALPFDLVYGNAVFQWVPDHLDVVTRLLATCLPGGVVALQVPDNRDEPTHMLMAAVARRDRWRAKFAEPIRRDPIPAASAYYDRLRPLAAGIDIWRTTYFHVLDDAAAIVEWVRGTGLRPYVERLDAAERAAYLAEYTAAIADAYPPLADGRVMLRFPRLFVVASRA